MFENLAETHTFDVSGVMVIRVRTPQKLDDVAF